MPSWFPQNVPESKHVRTYEEGFAAGLEAGAEMAEARASDTYYEAREAAEAIAHALRERAREEKAKP